MVTSERLHVVEHEYVYISHLDRTKNKREVFHTCCGHNERELAINQMSTQISAMIQAVSEGDGSRVEHLKCLFCSI